MQFDYFVTSLSAGQRDFFSDKEEKKAFDQMSNFPFNRQPYIK